VNEALVPVLGPSEARRLTDEIKRDAESLWRRLVELYEGGAHTALGYSSWQTYCEAEFGFGRSQSYRLLEAGRVAELVPHGGMNERQARELAPLLRDEDENAVAEVWSEVRAEHGERLTAEKVRTAVENKLTTKSRAPTRAPAQGEVESSTARLGAVASEEDFQKAVTDALTAFGWLWTHFRPGRTAKGWKTALSGAPGFPDIVAVRRDRVLFIELKTEKGRLSEDQERWLSVLGLAGADVHCWRPSDWPAIEETLR
jgi:hypothetical protein